MLESWRQRRNRRLKEENRAFKEENKELKNPRTITIYMRNSQNCPLKDAAVLLKKTDLDAAKSDQFLQIETAFSEEYPEFLHQNVCFEKEFSIWENFGFKNIEWPDWRNYKELFVK